MESSVMRVPFDREAAAAVPELGNLPSITPDMITASRAQTKELTPAVSELVGDKPIDWDEFDIPGPAGNSLRATLFRPRGMSAPAAGIVHMHGGGLIAGNRFTAANIYLEWVTEARCSLLTFDYRLAPENPYPAPVDDCYAALAWTASHAVELGIAPARLAVGGVSAGGGLAAAVALLARDRGGPSLAAQILVCPMLDNRNETTSARQFEGLGIWDRGSNQTGWDAFLGDQRGSSEVSPYASPARAADLSGLPPTIIDVGSAEVFRDECVTYASRIWQAGGVAELHVWPGGFHGFDMVAWDAAISRRARAARTAWIKRTLAEG